MRPRFMNRGSAMRFHSIPPKTPASMRPRFMNRGSAAPAASCAVQLHSFNEAPIHESGK